MNDFLKATLQVFLLSLFGIVCAALLLEAGFRIYRHFETHRTAWSDRPQFYFQPEGAETLQDFPHEPKKPEGVFRIAVIGDSYSFAPYMQFTDAFPKKLEQMLNLNVTKSKAEVINYGVPGYSTTHEVPKAELAVSEGADLIILQITLNDAEMKQWTPIGITNFDHFGPFKPSEGQAQLFRVWSSLGYVFERLHNSRTRQLYVKYFYDLFENPVGWSNFKKSIRRIRAIGEDGKVKLVAVVFPLFGVPVNDEYPFLKLHGKIDHLLEEFHIPTLDLLDTYRGLPLERIQVIPGDDRHPNEIAHRMAAEAIYSWLVEKSYIPSELVIKKRFKGRTKIIKEEPYP